MTHRPNRPLLKRFFLIVKSLPVGRPTTLGALAHELGVSYSTIQRDLNFLEMRFNFPIARDSSGVMLRSPVKLCPSCQRRLTDSNPSP